MNLKRVLIVAVLAFVAYYILRSPAEAASAFKGVGKVTISGLKDLAESVARFVDALFS